MSFIILFLDKDNNDKVVKIVNSNIFDHACIITTEEGKKNYRHGGKCRQSFVVHDFEKPVEDSAIQLESSLRKLFAEHKITELELGINISSGTGAHHAALLSAVMKLGYAFKLIELDKDGDVVAL